MRLFPFALLLLALVGCQSAAERPAAGDDASAEDPVRTGAYMLAEEDFERFEGQHLGLIVNHTAQVDTTHLIDLAHRTADVELVALFGPEHGLRGEADAGEAVEDGRDPRTGVPIYSLYGATRKPDPETLEDLDALVFDIQDVGARFYTYISTMGLAMQAAAEADLPFVVLDRPNPLGGQYVSGFLLEDEHESFVGQYPIPVAHGLTVAELARMIKGEGLLPGLDELQLDVVEMEGWERAMRWPATGLPWVSPSPNIPSVEAALVYAGTCFFEATSASEGRGTDEPFTLLGAPWADGQALTDTLNARELPGARFALARFTPMPNEGAAEPKLEGEDLEGIRIEVTDAEAYEPVETGIHVLHAFHAQARQQDVDDFIERPETLARLAGTDNLRQMLQRGEGPEAIIASWQDAADAFRERRQPYLLY